MISGIMARQYIIAPRRLLRDGLETVRIVLAKKNIKPKKRYFPGNDVERQKSQTYFILPLLRRW